MAIQLGLGEEERVSMGRRCMFTTPANSSGTPLLTVLLHYSEDEIHPDLRFVGAGILAMANAGPNTNSTEDKFQFSKRFIEKSYVTHRLPVFYYSCTHSILGWQTYDLWAGKQWDASGATIGVRNDGCAGQVRTLIQHSATNC